MRAISGAIIAAGALIGLGLLAVGLGLRYEHYTPTNTNEPWVHFRDLDGPMVLALVLLVCSLAIGIGTAFVGLALHHERRHWERHRSLTGGDSGIRTP